MPVAYSAEIEAYLAKVRASSLPFVNTNSWNTYTDTQHKFEIKYPLDWKLFKYGDMGNGVYIVYFEPNNTYFADGEGVIQVFVWDKSVSPVSLNDLEKEIKEEAYSFGSYWILGTSTKCPYKSKTLTQTEVMFGGLSAIKMELKSIPYYNSIAKSFDHSYNVSLLFENQQYVYKIDADTSPVSWLFPFTFEDFYKTFVFTK